MTDVAPPEHPDHPTGPGASDGRLAPPPPRGPGSWFSAEQEAAGCARSAGAERHGLASLLPWPAAAAPGSEDRR